MGIPPDEPFDRQKHEQNSPQQFIYQISGEGIFLLIFDKKWLFFIF